MKKLAPPALLLAFLLASTPSAEAVAVFKLTEVYSGVTGDDGTPDWFEITNFGDTAETLADVYFNDNSGGLGTAVALPTGFTISPGESVVGLIDVIPADEASEFANFATIWGPGIKLFAISGSGIGLNDSDTANLYDGAGANISTLPLTGLAGSVFTVENHTGMGAPRQSVFGENGAYVSAAFFNNELFVDPETMEPIVDMIAITGSPGRIPEPSAILLACLTLACGSAHRRRG